MRALAIAVTLLLGLHPALADDLALDGLSADQILASLAPSLKLDGLSFTRADCGRAFGGKRTVKGADRARLARCLVDVEGRPVITAGGRGKARKIRAIAAPPVVIQTFDEMHARRISDGVWLVSRPQDSTIAAMIDAGRTEVRTWFDFCVGPGGLVLKAAVSRSSGYPDYDAFLVQQIEQWEFEPLLVDGRPTPVCSTFRLVFRPETALDPPP